MKIYLASSWRNANVIIEHYLPLFRRQDSFTVDCFCDQKGGRTGFNIADELTTAGYNLRDVDAISALQHPAVREQFRIAFAEDKKWLDGCECCVMLMPCGKSAHLEGGYVKGQGKLLFIYWIVEPEKGEFDNMYQFADGLFRPRELWPLIETIQSYEAERRNHS